jgi:hypothetical protein
MAWDDGGPGSPVPAAGARAVQETVLGGAGYQTVPAGAGYQTVPAGAGPGQAGPPAGEQPIRPGGTIPMPEGRAVPARAAPTRPDTSRFGWIAAISTIAAECAIYGSIAAGARSRQVWPLAVLTVASVALTEIMVACRAGQVAAEHRDAPDGDLGLWRWLDGLVAPSAGWRVLIAMVVLAAASPRQALAAVLAVEAFSICWILAAVWLRWPSARFAAPADLDVLLRCRDDGPAARWAGRLVQGGLLPLPPAFAGLFATAMLGLLGLHSMRGFVAMTPPIVMMLAAPGSSHHHDGPSDWLVPVLLAAVQFVYLGTLGFALAVRGPLVFATCALLALWLAGAARRPFFPTPGIGWEGRMFLAGFGAVFGIGTAGFYGLAAFLGVLTCRTIARSSVAPGLEGPQ